jgi:hypothetical protein
MNFTITKLDRRHAWHDHFAYMVEFKKRTDWAIGRDATGVLEFDRCRKWFNETWGWSQDVETRNEMIKSIARSNVWQEDQVNCFWSYSIRYGEYRIYVNDAALTMFKLKWSADATA